MPFPNAALDQPINAEMDHRETGADIPVSRQRLEFAGWIRSNTLPDAVFVAGPAYGPWIGALAGWRLLLVEDSWGWIRGRTARPRAPF